MIIGLMLVRNEDWILSASLFAALEWCDKVVVIDHSSTDDTRDILSTFKRLHRERLLIGFEENTKTWNEMDVRQRCLQYGRNAGGAHFAMIDADEILTANLCKKIRAEVLSLRPGQVMDKKMIPVWRTLDQYRDDASVWSRAAISLAFADKLGMSWKPKEDGYHFHNRVPCGADPNHVKSSQDESGGVMHLQFAAWRRLTAKHSWYKMQEVTRWPGRKTVEQIDAMYNQALDETDIKYATIPHDWWGPYPKHLINLDRSPWQERDCQRMLAEFGPEKFAGLELWGVPDGATAQTGY